MNIQNNYLAFFCGWYAYSAVNLLNIHLIELIKLSSDSIWLLPEFIYDQVFHRGLKQKINSHLSSFLMGSLYLLHLKSWIAVQVLGLISRKSSLFAL